MKGQKRSRASIEEDSTKFSNIKHVKVEAIHFNALINADEEKILGVYAPLATEFLPDCRSRKNDAQTRRLLHLIEFGKENPENILHVQMLLKRGADPSQIGSTGKHSLALCCFYGKLKFFLEVIQFINDNTESCGHIWNVWSIDGFFPLHFVLFGTKFSIAEKYCALHHIVRSMKICCPRRDQSDFRVLSPGFVREKTGDVVSLVGYNTEGLIKRWYGESSSIARCLLQALNA
jgi:hypothetical protein